MIGLMRDRQLFDCPINNTDAILQIMFSGRHISVNWTIMGRSSLCFLMNALNLMEGRRLGKIPKQNSDGLLNQWPILVLIIFGILMLRLA